MRVYRYRPEEKDGSGAVTVSGVWSGNTELLSGSLCHQVLVKATTSSTTFDLTITDKHDADVRKFTDITGTINDLTPWLAKGIYTISISSASKNEAFTVLLCFRDR